MNCLLLGDIISQTELMNKYEQTKEQLLQWNIYAVLFGAINLLFVLLYSIRFSFIYARSIEYPLQELTLLLKNINFLHIYQNGMRPDDQGNLSQLQLNKKSEA